MDYIVKQPKIQKIIKTGKNSQIFIKNISKNIQNITILVKYREVFLENMKTNKK